jgi:hypothetical protein
VVTQTQFGSWYNQQTPQQLADWYKFIGAPVPENVQQQLGGVSSVVGKFNGSLTGQMPGAPGAGINPTRQIGIPEVQGPNTPDNRYYNDPTGQGMGQAPENRPGMQRPNPVQADLGFMPFYEDQLRQLDSSAADAQSQGDLTVQRIQNALQQGTQRLSQQQQQQSSQLNDRMAANGILRSGITVGEQGKLADQYTQNLGDLQQNAAMQTDDTKRAVLQALQAISSQRGQINMNMARDKAQAQQQADMQNALAEAQYQALLAQQPAANPQGMYTYQPIQAALMRAIGS